METFALASRIAAQTACAGSSIPHLSELIHHFAGGIEIALLHGDTSPDHMAGLVAVFGCAHALPGNIASPQIVLVIYVVGFDQEPRHGLDLIVENQHVRIPCSVCRLACPSNIRLTAAERRALEEIGFRGTKPSEMGVDDIGAVLGHDPVKREADIRPIEVTKEALVAEDQILPTGL